MGNHLCINTLVKNTWGYKQTAKLYSLVPNVGSKSLQKLITSVLAWAPSKHGRFLMCV